MDTNVIEDKRVIFHGKDEIIELIFECGFGFYNLIIKSTGREDYKIPLILQFYEISRVIDKLNDLDKDKIKMMPYDTIVLIITGAAATTIKYDSPM